MALRALTPDEARELADLRARAYGPAPDIADDPAALARLAALEAVLRAPDAPAGDRSPQEAVAEQPGEGRRPAVEPAASASLPPPLAPVPRGRWTLLLRSGWLAAGLLAVLGAVAAWAAWYAAAPRPDVSLPRVGIEREVSDELTLPGFIQSDEFDLQEIQRFEPFGPLQAWLALSRSGRRCLLLAAVDYGIVGINCTPPGLDPIVDLRVRPGMREDIVGDFPVDTVLRFQNREQSVDVWVRSPIGAA